MKTLVGLSPSPRLDLTSPTFRAEAVACHLRGESPAALLAVTTPSAWGCLLLLATLVLAGLAFAVLGTVEVTARGRGALRTTSEVLAIHTEVPGTVAEVRVWSGQQVKAGQVLARLEAAGMRAALLEAERQLAFVEKRTASSASRRRILSLERQRLLGERLTLGQQQIARQEETIARLQRRRQDLGTLAEQGYLGRHQTEDVDEELTAASRQLLTLRQAATESEAQLSALVGEREWDSNATAQEREQAQARRDAAALMLERATIVAPRDGLLEAVLVRPGQVLAAGAFVGKLVPLGAPTQLVAFIDEKDRAFLSRGAPVRIELDQLPLSEFGWWRGTVERVAEDVASPAELEELLGAGAASGRVVYRVDVAVGESSGSSRRLPRLRPGMLATVRVTLRRKRVLSLVFRAFGEGG